MKPLLLLLVLLPLSGKGQQDSLPEENFPWQEDLEYWQDLYNNPDYRNYYQGKNPEEMIRQAFEYAKENGVTEDNQQDFLEELAEDISDQLLESFGEEVLEQLMEETGLARYLDQVYEKLLKATLPKPGGIPMFDVGMELAINKGKTPHNLKAMLKLAVEKWLNEQWEKQVKDIYTIQREDLEYRKKVGLITLLKMARLEYEHFLSLEILLPEQVLNYATQVQQIYQSAEESLVKGKQLFTELNSLATDLEVPQQLQKLHLLEASSTKARTSSWEMINERRRALALAYQQMAERSRQKGKDLQGVIKTEEHFKMSDGNRLKAQEVVNAYMQDYFRYQEKADLLLKASLENAGISQKAAHIARYQQTIRIKNLVP